MDSAVPLIGGNATPERRIDVLIPVHNVATTVESAIDSIRTQTIANIRIVVINDGSTDETAAILAALAIADPRVVVITRPRGGIVDALNAGLAECSAELVARHDGDDIAYPHRFAEQVAYLDAHPDCVAVSSFARQIDECGRPSGLAIFPPLDSSDPRWIPCREPYLLHPFLMVRRSALLSLAGYRHVHHAEDADLCWRLQEIGKLHAIPKMLGDYRVHSQSITGRSPLNGRLSALNSQLAAVSALRRRQHQVDLIFTKAAIEQMSSVATMRGIYDVGRRGLSSAESAFLKPAFAAKFLELASYRPYEPDLDDCLFIGAALKLTESELPPANRIALRRLRAMASARLLIKGRVRASLALLSVETLIETGVRFCVYCITRCMPANTRSAIWSWRCKTRAMQLEKRDSAA